MKKTLYTINLLILTLLTATILNAQGIPTRDTVVMGPGYADDVYYSFSDGVVAKAARNTWDIAFYTNAISAGVMTNEGNGIQLFTYPNGDINDWAAVDTIGMMSWTIMYNSAEYWEEGAFNANSKDHPDYGWGTYNSVDHNVYGDSIFVITNGDWVKKLMIEKKESALNIYHFTYADLDGSNEQDIQLEVTPYTDKRFVYYSLENNEVLDRDPEKESWDILFSKYYESVTDNEGNVVRYPVTGALCNVDIRSNNFYPVQQNYIDWSAKEMDSTKNSIGYDWKDLNEEWQYFIIDSNYYFVKDYNGDIYKLGFVSWEGSSTGVCILDQWLVSLSDVDEINQSINEVSVYPNPATDHFTIKSNFFKDDSQVSIIDQAGKIIYSRSYTVTDLVNGIGLRNLNLSKGLYILSIKNEHQLNTQKLVIR